MLNPTSGMANNMFAWSLEKANRSDIGKTFLIHSAPDLTGILLMHQFVFFSAVGMNTVQYRHWFKAQTEMVSGRMIFTSLSANQSSTRLVRSIALLF